MPPNPAQPPPPSQLLGGQVQLPLSQIGDVKYPLHSSTQSIAPPPPQPPVPPSAVPPLPPLPPLVLPPVAPVAPLPVEVVEPPHAAPAHSHAKTSTQWARASMSNYPTRRREVPSVGEEPQPSGDRRRPPPVSPLLARCPAPRANAESGDRRRPPPVSPPLRWRNCVKQHDPISGTGFAKNPPVIPPFARCPRAPRATSALVPARLYNIQRN